MTTRKRVFSIICDLLVCLGLLGLVVPPYSLAKDKGEQREVEDELQDEADDEGDDRNDQDGKDHLERCLRALSQGKEVPAKSARKGEVVAALPRATSMAMASPIWPSACRAKIRRQVDRMLAP